MTQDFSAKQIELLQLARVGALHVVQALSEGNVVLTFQLAELLDLEEGVTRHWPNHFDFDKPRLSAREIAGAVREGYLALPEGVQWWAPCLGSTATSQMNTTDKTDQLLQSHWPVFTYQPAFGDDGWTHNATVKIRRAWLVPGNIVHSSRGIRFQISRLHRTGLVTQIWSGQNDHSERYDSNGLIEVETASLNPGQQYLTV